MCIYTYKNTCKCPYANKCSHIKIQCHRIAFLNLTCSAKVRKTSYVCDMSLWTINPYNINSQPVTLFPNISQPPTVSCAPFYMLPIYLLTHSTSIKSITNPHSALISEIYLTKSINNYFEHLIISQLEKHSSEN